MRRTVAKKSPTSAIGEPIATSTPKVNELTKRRVNGANGTNGTGANGATLRGEEKKGGKQVRFTVDEKPRDSSVSSSSSIGWRLVRLVFLLSLLLLVALFATIVIFERHESSSFVQSQPWLVDVRRAYYEPIKEVALQKYNAAFAR